jgi:hypothetical protein
MEDGEIGLNHNSFKCMFGSQSLLQINRSLVPKESKVTESINKMVVTE